MNAARQRTSRSHAGVPRSSAPPPEGSSVLLIQNRQRTRAIDTDFLRSILLEVLATRLQVPHYEIGLHLVGAREMAAINREYLQHDGSTDVITFDHSDDPPDRPAGRAGRSLHGEIYVSIPDAVAQAKVFNTTWREELIRYAIHGVLHLLGYDDLRPSARRVMKRAENRLVAAVLQDHPAGRPSSRRKR